MPRTSRWRRLGAATAMSGVVLAAAGCSGSSHRAVPPPAATASPAAQANGAAALATAQRLTAALHSYAFRASQALQGGSRPQSTLLVGRAVRPASVAYTITIGGRAEDVVKVGAVTYLRVPPAAWKALDRPGPQVDPLDSLIRLLGALRSPSLSGSTLSGVVGSGDLTAARLAPAGAAGGRATVPVQLTLDPAGRVTGLTVRLSIQAGSNRLTLVEQTLFAGFDAVPPIRPPGAVTRRR